MTIQSASRIRVVAASSTQSPAQVRVNGVRGAGWPPARHHPPRAGRGTCRARGRGRAARSRRAGRRRGSRAAARAVPGRRAPARSRRRSRRGAAVRRPAPGGGAGRRRAGARRARSAVSSWGGRSVGRREREGDPHPGALLGALGVDELDGAAVQVGDPARDGEAEPGAAAAVVRCERPERLEDPLAVRRRDARPLVLHLEPPGSAGPGGGDGDGAAGRAVAGGVVEQVGDELAQPRRIGLDDEVHGLDPGGVPDVAAADPGLGDGGLEQLADRDGLGESAGPCRRRRGRGRGGPRPGGSSRRAWSRAAVRDWGSRGATPSTRFSSTATRPASGVRSSWLTLATSSRRCRSTVARSRAIVLNARARSPTSSLEVSVTRTA